MQMSEREFRLPPFPTSREAAAWFEGRARKERIPLSAVKLQCLLYLAQGFHMAENDGHVLFPALFIVTARGPQDPMLYRVMDGFLEAEDHVPDAATERFMTRLWRRFAGRSEEALLGMIGRDRLYAAVMTEAGAGGIIPLQAMDERFAEIVSAARSAGTAAATGNDAGKEARPAANPLPPRRVFDDIARDLLTARQAPAERKIDPTAEGPVAIRRWAPRRRVEKTPDISFAEDKSRKES